MGQGDWETEKRTFVFDSTVFCWFWPCMTTWKDTRFIVPYYRWYDVSISLDIAWYFFELWDSLGTVLFLCILFREYQKILFNFCNVLTLLSGMLLGSNFQFLFAEVIVFLFVFTLNSVQSKNLFGLMTEFSSWVVYSTFSLTMLHLLNNFLKMKMSLNHNTVNSLAISYQSF